MDKRTRTGCFTCRRRRVKCDESKPSCDRCRTANFVCEGYQAPQRASNGARSRKSSSSHESSPQSIAGLSYRRTNWRLEEMPLYHHFVTTTVSRLFRNDHVSFWRDQVAQMSFELDVVYEALLAISAMHRASLLTCDPNTWEESSKLRVFGLGAYGKVLKLLPPALSCDSMSKRRAVLVVLMLLAYFECFMENPKGALHHLWAAIQLLKSIEKRLSATEALDLVPVQDAMLRLDFQAQKLIPFSNSSFSHCSKVAMEESPFWSRPSLSFPGRSFDPVAAERYRLIQLICGHNSLSRVIWGTWCPTSERPSRDELMGFYDELLLWRANSPATFASCSGLDTFHSLDSIPVESFAIPPPACHFSSKDAALNISMYNAYLGCALAQIGTTDEDPEIWEQEAFRLVYQSLCITQGLMDEHSDMRARSEDPYKPCDALSTGMSLYLVYGTRRCYSAAWQRWTIAALRSIGPEGLSNGLSAANGLDIQCTLQAITAPADETAYLGPISQRLIPMFMPCGSDGRSLAFYLRYGTPEIEGDESAMRVIAKASWDQEPGGAMRALKLEVYERAMAGDSYIPERPDPHELFSSWRGEVEKGWHGYLAKGIQDGFLKKETLPAY